MITIVSGLPRSGTSLTMQMLKAAGYPVFWNREPNVDANNPRGYYEWEESKKLWQSAGPPLDTLFSRVDGHIVKMFPQVFPCLSPNFSYQIIYIDRNIDEVIASQRAMMLSRSQNPKEIKRDFLIKLWYLANVYLSAFRSIVIPHSELYKPIGPFNIERFLAGGLVSNSRVLAMQNCVDPSLRHHLLTAA